MRLPTRATRSRGHITGINGQRKTPHSLGCAGLVWLGLVSLLEGINRYTQLDFIRCGILSR